MFRLKFSITPLTNLGLRKSLNKYISKEKKGYTHKPWDRWKSEFKIYNILSKTYSSQKNKCALHAKK